jgi:hypothetical protein
MDIFQLNSRRRQACAAEIERLQEAAMETAATLSPQRSFNAMMDRRGSAEAHAQLVGPHDASCAARSGFLGAIRRSRLEDGHEL